MEICGLKTVKVVAAVIRSVNGAGEPVVLATERKSHMASSASGFEFPGGKIEEGETPQEALVREIREELEAEIRVGEKIQTIEFDYSTFHLSMDCFLCTLLNDHISLKEHESAKWLTRDTLQSVQWLPADLELIDLIKEKL